MKSLLIINEDFSQMSLGQNTSLYYLVQSLKNQHDAFIWNIDENFMHQNSSSISCLFIEKNSPPAQKLVQTYEKYRDNIITLTKNKDFDSLLNLKTPKIEELSLKLSVKEVNFAEFDHIIQRLEPMKAPFPPKGKHNIDDYLEKLKTIFLHKKVHLPISLNDKLLPLELDNFLKNKVATPTFITHLGDDLLHQKVTLAAKKYQEFYNSSHQKIVLKPINSAQSLGVFAINFDPNGMNLADLKEKFTDNLQKSQIFHINKAVSPDELSKIIEILCFLQNTTIIKKIDDISYQIIQNSASALYNDKILVQPFIEGIKSGDIRANFSKNDQDDFYLSGYVYRKSIQKDDNFTTCYSGGKALCLPISYLSQIEQDNLKESTENILSILNNQLRQKYKNVLELGCDFLLMGDEKNILLGEVNHHCPALLPISEKLNF